MVLGGIVGAHRHHWFRQQLLGSRPTAVLKCIISFFFLKNYFFPPLIYNCHLAAIYLATCLWKSKNVNFKLQSTKPIWKSQIPPIYTERGLTHFRAHRTTPLLFPKLYPSEMISSRLLGFFFWDKDSYSPGWPWAYYIAKDDPERLILLNPNY